MIRIDSDFGGFEEEPDDEGKLKKMEREVRFLKRMMYDVLLKMQEQLTKENGNLKKSVSVRQR